MWYQEGEIKYMMGLEVEIGGGGEAGCKSLWTDQICWRQVNLQCFSLQEKTAGVRRKKERLRTEGVRESLSLTLNCQQDDLWVPYPNVGAVRVSVIQNVLMPPPTTF